MRARFISSICAFAMLCCAQPLCAQVTLGQVDEFSDGTLQGWGGGANPTNIPDGGPTGDGDNFLQITSTGGFGIGSRLATVNATQWMGNFVAAGVISVEVDLKNFSDKNLQMRVVLFSPDNIHRWTTKTAFPMTPFQDWTHATFFLSESNMVKVAGTQTFEQVMTNCGQMMFRHDDEPPSSGGTSIAAQLGIDNVAAAAGALSNPTTMNVIFGSVVSGNIDSLKFNDQDRLVIRNGLPFLITQSPITVEFSGTAAHAVPSALTMNYVGHVSLGGLTQRLDLFDYSNNGFAQQDQRPAPVGGDLAIAKTFVTGAAKYVNSSDAAYRFRLRVKDDTPAFLAVWQSRSNQIEIATVP